MLNSYYSIIFSERVNSEMQNLASAIMSGYSSYQLGNFSSEEFNRIMSILPYEYPLTYKVFLNEYNGTGSSIQLYYHEYDDNLFVEKMNELLQNIQSKISYNDTTYDIVKKIYDYITTNFDYDLELLNKVNTLDMNDNNAVREFNKEHGASFNIYGVVVNKKGVCAGLCQLFKYLLYSFGIESTCILGQFVRNDEPTNTGHTVVLVEIDGEYAFVDVAGGMHNASCLDVTLYSYFLVPYDVIKQTIAPMYEEYNFDNVSSNLSYYCMNNLMFDSIDKVRIYLNGIINHEKQKVVYMLYTGKVATERQLIKIIDDVVGFKKGDNYGYNRMINDGNIVIKIYKDKR